MAPTERREGTKPDEVRDNNCVRLLLHWSPGPDGHPTCSWRVASMNSATIRLPGHTPDDLSLAS